MKKLSPDVFDLLLSKTLLILVSVLKRVQKHVHLGSMHTPQLPCGFGSKHPQPLNIPEEPTLKDC